MFKRRSRGRPSDQAIQQGPTWWRIDLHLHTPGSSDYQEPRATYLDVLQKAEARGLDIIAFTDHNTVAGYAALRRDISQLEFLEANNRLMPEETRRLHEYRRLLNKILVLPGFEFTATFGFHILGIFPPETSVRKLEHVLLELSIPEEKLDLGSSEVGATTDVLRAYEIIAEAGGLVIGAHVNSTHGIAMIGLGFGGQTKIAYTQDPNLHALEVTDLESTTRRATSRFFNGSKPEYPRRMHCIQGSDAHRLTRDPQRPEKNLGIGDRCTEVLLPEVGFEALRALFASTDFSRTRPARAPEQHPFDPLMAARQEGATIVQSFHDTPGPPRIRVKAVVRDLVAFANTNGGTVYVGASANAQEPIRGVEGANELVELIKSESARQVVPPLAPDIETLTHEDKAVLVVTVPRGTETPYALEPGYIYVRQESETALALRDEIVQLVRAALAPDTVGFDPSTALRPRAVVRPQEEPEPEELPIRPAPSPPAPVAPAPPMLAAPPVAAAPQAMPQSMIRPAIPAPPPRVAQQVAVSEATAAEQERQQDRTPVPRTGVEIIASIERNGIIFHTVRDLRNRRVVRNVTRESARRLWRYAILQVEEHELRSEDVAWDTTDPRRGYWKGYRQPEGMRRYNLVYREPQGPRNGAEPTDRLRVFYGVTEDGIDDRWRAVLPPESVPLETYYDEPLPPADMPAPVGDPPAPRFAVDTQPDWPPISEYASAPAPAYAPPPVADMALPEPEPVFVAEQSAMDQDEPVAEVASAPEAAPSAPKPRSRARGPRRRAAAPSVEAEAAAPLAEPEYIAPESVAPVVVEASPAPEAIAEEAAPAKPKRAPRRKKAAETAPALTEAVAEVPVRAVPIALVAEVAPAPEPPAPPEAPTPAPARRRRAPRKAAADAPQAD
ncbi:MAG: putative DNA binding domain-containing protein [Thermomicrobiales bacterium]